MTSEKDSSPKYPSDISDEEWEIVKKFFEELEPYTTGRPRSSDLREILNAIFYLNKTGCPWRYLPNDFPSYKLVNYYYNKWTDNKLLEKLNTALREHLREKKTENQIQQGRSSTVKVSREPQSLDSLLGSMAVS
ncbi:MAG: transposase [Chromatiales bacterium]|nr:transposase [Chromatiales bacterium]MCK7579210.1 transposase [Chromatiales bacterium]MCK7581791.1 transposase [Chromatiales bacterium]